MTLSAQLNSTANSSTFGAAVALAERSTGLQPRKRLVLNLTAFVLGTEEGLNLIESLEGIEAVFIARDRTITYSSGAEAYIIH